MLCFSFIHSNQIEYFSCTTIFLLVPIIALAVVELLRVNYFQKIGLEKMFTILELYALNRAVRHGKKGYITV